MLNPAMRFLRAEQERIELELHRIEYTVNGAPENDPFYREYQRRLEIVQELVPLAVTSDTALAAAEEKLLAAHMLGQELVEAGRGDVHDDMIEVLAIDIAYLEGLLLRLQAGITAETYIDNLKGVDRL